MSKAKPVTVKVHIEDNPIQFPPEPYKFWLGTDDSKIGKKKGKELTFENEGHDGFEITFEIEDDTSPRQGFKFMDDVKGPDGKSDPNHTPMWVKTVEDFDESCPNHELWDQFETVSVTGNNTKLQIRNWNFDEKKFKFAFMFSRTPHEGSYQIMYDPDGNNQNGPRTLIEKNEDGD